MSTNRASRPFAIKFRPARALIAVVVFGLSGRLVLSPAQGDLGRELHELSSLKGFALARSPGSGLTILPFGGKDVQRPLGTLRFLIAHFSPEGKRLVGYTGTDLVVTDSSGTVLWRVGGATMIRTLALSQDSHRVAFIGVDHATMTAGIFWVEEGSNDLRRVHQFGQYPSLPRAGGSQVDEMLSESPSVGWSEGSKEIVFSTAHKVQIFDTVSSAERMIADGDYPSWSPDGEWIAYRSLNGRASLIHPNGAGERQLGKRRKIMSMIHWSPDSQFVFVDEDWGSVAPQVGCVTNTRFVVYRLHDGASLPVYDPCGIRDAFFGWIADFRTWGTR
jgi:hypothetical protein